MTNVGTAINRMGQSLAYVCFPLCCRCLESQSAEDTQHSAPNLIPHACAAVDGIPRRRYVEHQFVTEEEPMSFYATNNCHLDNPMTFTSGVIWQMRSHPIAQLIRSMVFGVRFGVVCSVQCTACDVQSERPSLLWKQVVIYSQRKRCRPGCWHCMSTTWRKLSTSGPCPDSERFEMRRLLRRLPWSL